MNKQHKINRKQNRIRRIVKSLPELERTEKWMIANGSTEDSLRELRSRMHRLNLRKGELEREFGIVTIARP